MCKFATLRFHRSPVVMLSGFANPIGNATSAEKPGRIVELEGRSSDFWVELLVSVCLHRFSLTLEK